MKNQNQPLLSIKNIIFGFVFLFSTSVVYTQTISSPDGYAGYAGTTGGGSASSTTVYSASALRTAVSGSSSKVIIVSGRIDLGGDITIGSNTTLIGANTSSGLYGGTVKIQGSNFIIQNLTFGPSDGDVLEVSEATNVYITKCTFHDSSDELCSVVRQSDYVTISWCKFYFDSPDSHSYAHLIGNGDDVTADRGKLHVTLHHNWYSYGIVGRMPRVRYGYVHIYNNYYNSTSNDYCIGVGYECHIRVENTHFDNVSNPWKDFGGTTSGGVIGWSNILFDGSSQPTFISNSYPVFSLPYSFSLDNVSNVESVVKAGAGNVASSSSGSSYYSIMNKNSGKYIDVYGASTSNNADVIQYTYSGADNQLFAFVDSDDSEYFLIKAKHSGKCLRAVSGNVVQYDCYGSYWTEMFQTVDAGDGYYLIKNRNTGTCLRIENSSTSDGASVILDDCNTSYWSEQFSSNGLKNALMLSEVDEISSDLYSIYPTSSNDIIYINLPEEYTDQAHLYVYTNAGGLVEETVLIKGYIDVSKLNKGLYLIVIQDNNKTYTHKFIKK